MTEPELRRELRPYLRGLMTPEVRAELRRSGENGDLWRELVERLGADGWLRLGWPREHGGRGGTLADQYVLLDEVMRAGAPYPFVTLLTVAPALMLHGTEEQRRSYLPGILAGELLFSIGYTEPDAGTDLAALRTRAVRAGDDWVVNGSKVYTSGAGQADYVWLACRTDPGAPPHQGISILIVPTSAPGFSWTPLPTVGEITTTTTYYDDVRVPGANLVGELHRGWSLITHQLTHERIGLAAWGARAHLAWAETVVAGCDERAGAERPIDRPWFRVELARAHSRLEAMKLLNRRIVEEGEPSPADAAVAKVFGTETVRDVFRDLCALAGDAGAIRAGSPGAAFDGLLELGPREATINTFGGGVNEVLRDFIATSALGLPKASRRAA